MNVTKHFLNERNEIQSYRFHTYIGFKTSNVICTHCGHVFKTESIENKEKLPIKFKILTTFLGRGRSL